MVEYVVVVEWVVVFVVVFVMVNVLVKVVYGIVDDFLIMFFFVVWCFVFMVLVMDGGMWDYLVVVVNVVMF